MFEAVVSKTKQKNNNKGRREQNAFRKRAHRGGELAKERAWCEPLLSLELGGIPCDARRYRERHTAEPSSFADRLWGCRGRGGRVAVPDGVRAARDREATGGAAAV